MIVEVIAVGVALLGPFFLLQWRRSRTSAAGRCKTCLTLGAIDTFAPLIGRRDC